jgi:glycerol-3-phosphate acyltransferase PlsY
MSSREFLTGLLLILGGYLSGSVMFARVIPMIMKNKDICELSSDGNPGVFNAFDLCGWRIGFLCLAFELGKGCIPVMAALVMTNGTGLLLSAVMVSAVLGHAFPVFNRFRGGKCIAVIFGELIALLRITPVCLILAVLYILFSTVLKINPNRRRSIVTFSLFIPISVITELYFHRSAVAAGCAAVSMIAIYKHLTDRSDSRRTETERQTDK